MAVDVEDEAGVRGCTGAVVLRYAGGAFRGVMVVAGTVCCPRPSPVAEGEELCRAVLPLVLGPPRRP